MSASIWSDTLAEFRARAGGADPVPAGVSISAVTASLALALIAKVLEITGRKKGRESVAALLDATRRESSLLARLADDDIRAFNRYMDCVRRKESTEAALHDAINIPMDAARSVIRGLGLCREASALCSTGLTAADLGSSASLLRGATQAMLLSVESNLTHLPANDPFRQEIVSGLPGLKSRLSDFEHNNATETRRS
jgi:formiminotetrahydrofolate cyclodeaminase